MWKTTGKLVWNPWHELFDMDKAFGRFFRGDADFPPTNVWSSDDALTFTFEVPGMKAEDFDISAKPDTLTLKGARSIEPLPENAAYIRQERSAGSFVRSFALPFKIDSEKVTASYSNGILTVTLPKAVEVKPRKIAIGTN